MELIDGDKKQTVQLPPNTWDASSFAWNFAFAPLGRQGPSGVRDRRPAPHRVPYSIVGREKLATPLGELDTVHVKKIQDEGDKRAFDVWLAIERHYLPVRIRATEKDGTVFDSMVESVNLAHKP